MATLEQTGDTIDGRTQERECSVGKSCGNTCIDSKYVCNSSLSPVVSSSLGKLKSNFGALTNGKVVPRPSNLSKYPNGSTPSGTTTYDKYAKLGRGLLRKFPKFQKLSKELQAMTPKIVEIDTKLRSSDVISQSDVNKLRSKLFKLTSVSSVKVKELGAEMVKVRGEMLKSSLSDGQIKDLMGRVNVANSVKSKQLDQSLEEFIRMFEGKGILPMKGKYPSLQRVDESKYDGRSYALLSKGAVALEGAPNTIKSKFFHETGHIVESQRHELLKFAEDWRNRKAFSDRDISRVRDINGKPLVRVGSVMDSNGVRKPVLRLNQIAGYNYEDKEVAVMDKFDNPYMGKVYRHSSTEVISIAMEAFSSPQSMTLLYINHPELFEVVAGLTR